MILFHLQQSMSLLKIQHLSLVHRHHQIKFYNKFTCYIYLIPIRNFNLNKTNSYCFLSLSLRLSHSFTLCLSNVLKENSFFSQIKILDIERIFFFPLHMRSIDICLCLSFLFISPGVCWLDIKDLDRSIRPTDDFFSFVNNRWLNQTNIPKTEVAWGSLFTMQHENKYLLENLLNDLIRNESIDELNVHPSIKRRLTDFYLAGLDEQAIDDAGLEPVRNLLVQLKHVRTYEQLLTFICNVYKRLNTGLIFHFEVLPDDRNTSIYMADWQVN